MFSVLLGEKAPGVTTFLTDGFPREVTKLSLSYFERCMPWASMKECTIIPRLAAGCSGPSCCNQLRTFLLSIRHGRLVDAHLLPTEQVEIEAWRGQIKRIIEERE